MAILATISAQTVCSEYMFYLLFKHFLRRRCNWQQLLVSVKLH